MSQKIDRDLIVESGKDRSFRQSAGKDVATIQNFGENIKNITVRQGNGDDLAFVSLPHDGGTTTNVTLDGGKGVNRLHIALADFNRATITRDTEGQFTLNAPNISNLKFSGYEKLDFQVAGGGLPTREITFEQAMAATAPNTPVTISDVLAKTPAKVLR